MTKGMSRRNFLRTGGAATTLAAAAASGCTNDGDSATPDSELDTSDSGEVGEDVQDITLYCGPLETVFSVAGVDTPVRLRAYGFEPNELSVPGPTIATNGGQALNITVVNRFEDYEGSGMLMDSEGNNVINVPHKLNHTNLHLHGIEIQTHLFANDDGTLSLSTSEDEAAMYSVEPGSESQVYGFKLPDNHPTGLFWYHPHHHGSTAVQAVTGMAGGVVITGALDEHADIAAMADVDWTETVAGETSAPQKGDIVLVYQDIGVCPPEDGGAHWYLQPKTGRICDSGTNLIKEYDEDACYTVVEGATQGYAYGPYPRRFFLCNGRPIWQNSFNDLPEEEGGSWDEPLVTREPPNVPTYTIRPGQAVRVRMLNGNSDLVMPLHMEGQTLKLIGMDGVNYEETREYTTQDNGDWDGVTDYNPSATSLVMAGGNRAEFVVLAPLDASEGDEYVLHMLGHKGEQLLKAEAQVLARFKVAGEPLDAEMATPSGMPAPARHYPLAEAEVDDGFTVEFHAFAGPVFDDEGEITNCTVAFQNPRLGADFTIRNTTEQGLCEDTDENGDAVACGELYTEEAIARRPQLGSVEDWTIQATHDEGHPFHIHVNAFQVLSIKGVAQPAGTILDTVWVPKASTDDEGNHSPTQVKIRSHFQTWTGKAVFHCHILVHEDTGMMSNFIIE
jgi:suppressor of ftsI